MGRTFGRCVAAGTAAYLVLGALGLIARGTGATSRGLASLSSIAVFTVLSLSVPVLVGMLGARGARALTPRPRSVDVALVTGSAAMAGRLLGQPQLVWMMFSRPLPAGDILGIGGIVIGGLVTTGVIAALSGLIASEAFLPKASPRETNSRHPARIDRRVRPRDPVAFRFCFFAALGLEVLAALGHAAVFDIDTVLIWRADIYRAVHTIERGFHWLLPVCAGVAYVVRARGTASLRAWAGTGAMLGLVPHLLAAAARLGALWVASSLRGYHRHAWGVIRSFDSGFLREAAIATLLGAAAALAAALAGGERRQGPSPARAPTVLKQLDVLAASSFIAIPLVAATLFVGIDFLWQLPRLLHEAVHPGSRVVCASHALAAWLAPLFLLALFGLAGALRLGGATHFRMGVVGAGGLWYVWVLSHQTSTNPVALDRLGTAFYSLLVWFTPLALALAIGLAGPPAVAAIGLLRRRSWGRRLAAGVAATCFLIVANAVAWTVRSELPPTPWPGLAELGPVLEYRALMAAVGAGPVLLLLGWAWRFLTREDVRELFVED